MKLLTPAIQLALPKIYSTDETPIEEKVVICKFFTPWSFWSWFVFEGEPERNIFQDKNSNDFLFYGMVHGFEKEMGYFRLSELESVRGPRGLTLQQDMLIFKTPYANCCNMKQEDSYVACS